MKSATLYRIIFFSLCISFIWACQSGVVYRQKQSIPPDGWHYKDGIHFDVDIQDTLSLHALYLDVRNTTDYAYSNLFLFMEIEFPDKRVIRDTLECLLANRRGQWTGRGFGNTRTNRFLFRDDVWFPTGGTYQFRIYQGMRHEQLEGVSYVGIRIRKK